MSAQPRRKRHIGLRLLLLLLAALALLTVDSQVRLVTDAYECPISALPDAFDGFRIVQLSDLHGVEFGADNKRLLAAVRAAAPDMIALTGDFVTGPADLPVTEKLFPALSAIAPCYFVSGNHEWASGCVGELAEQMARSGVTYLENEYLPVSRGGEEILLCGVEDPNSWSDLMPPDELVRRARQDWPGRTIVLLGHRNYWVEKYPDLAVDLILCGHEHGGIVRLPGIGGLLGTDRQLLPEFSGGVFHSGSYAMIVSRGLGNIHHTLRFLNNPEIVLVTLKKAA